MKRIFPIFAQSLKMLRADAEVVVRTFLRFGNNKLAGKIFEKCKTIYGESRKTNEIKTILNENKRRGPIEFTKFDAGVMMHEEDRKAGCSAEGHVSHVYSNRMSSRPLGWCRTGADKMARLRIYRQNGRVMLELTGYQKEELADMPVYSIPYPQVKKIAALKNHIWGCKIAEVE